MSIPSTTRLADLLKRTGLFQDDQIKALLAQKIEGNTSITRRVIEAGYVPEEEFLTALREGLSREQR